MPIRSSVLSVVLASAPLLAAAADAPPSPAPPQARMSAAECEVWARELSFAQSVADHDAAAFAAHLEPDAAFSVEAPEPLRGRDAITREWDGIIHGTDVLLSWYPTRTTIAGTADIASSAGPVLVEDTRPGARQHYRIGTFHSVWHRGPDATWRVMFDGGGQRPVAATEAEAAAFKTGQTAICPQ
jgi:ketosteroid isomerase-like protein